MAGMFNRLQEEIAHQDKVAGLSTVDLLDMAPDTRRIIQLLMRRGELSLEAIADALGPDGTDTEALASRLGDIAQQGFILAREHDGQTFYHTAFGRRRQQAVPLDLWAMLTERADALEEAGDPGDPGDPDDSNDPETADGPSGGEAP